MDTRPKLVKKSELNSTDYEKYIFDFDGTLVNTNKRQYLCFVTTVQKMKLTTNISFQKYLDLKETHLSNAGIYQLLFPEHNNLNLFLKIFIKILKIFLFLQRMRYKKF